MKSFLQRHRLSTGTLTRLCAMLALCSLPAGQSARADFPRATDETLISFRVDADSEPFFHSAFSDSPPNLELSVGADESEEIQPPESTSPPENSADDALSPFPLRTFELGTIRSPNLPRPEEYRRDIPAKRRKVEAEFGDGLSVRSDDDFFSLTFHNLTQVDLRLFNPTGDPLHDAFFIPRQRWYVLGNVSPFVRYYTVINRGYGSLDLLDAFVDLNVGIVDREQLQFRIGRMKTPYTYEYIKIAENDLIAPERSVFVTNLAPNREIGVMAHGHLLNRTLEYSVGAFNGPRRSFQDFNSGKDFFVYGMTKPFLHADSEALEQLNIGGSFNFGMQHGPAQPFALRTANDQSESAAAGNVSPTFFRFLPEVFEQGLRMQWSADIAYYFRSLGIVAGYQGGFQGYSIATGTPPPDVQTIRLGLDEFVGVNGTPSTRVPMSGYQISVFYFVTGERITRRDDLLEPRHEFDGSWRAGRMGAVELFGRFAGMQLGSAVFASKLADPSISSNRANVVDLGVNWYLTHYTKLTFDWQYAAYPTPVFLTPTRNTSFNNLFWFRTQVFF